MKASLAHHVRFASASMAGKKSLQDATPPSKPSDSNGGAGRPASAPATRVLPQRQGLHSPRASSAGKPPESFRSDISDSQQRRGPEKQPVLLPHAASAQNGEQDPQQQPSELQSSSPRAAKAKGSTDATPDSSGSRPTSGIKRLTRSGMPLIHSGIMYCNEHFSK